MANRINECGHPDRKYCARGMCAGCYSSWRLKNRSGYRDIQKRYRQSHKEKFREYNREYMRRKAARGIKQKRAPLEVSRARGKKYREKFKMMVLSHYGNSCACCGEREPKFLTIDHINGGGRAHRKELGNTRLNEWLVKNGFPEGFRVLCYNCNCGRSRNGGICPHKERNGNS